MISCRLSHRPATHREFYSRGDPQLVRTSFWHLKQVIFNQKESGVFCVCVDLAKKSGSNALVRMFTYEFAVGQRSIFTSVSCD